MQMVTLNISDRTSEEIDQLCSEIGCDLPTLFRNSIRLMKKEVEDSKRRILAPAGSRVADDPSD